MNRPDQIRELFRKALDRSGPERALLLERSCAGDRALLDEVQSLLAAYDRAPRGIEEPVFRLRQMANAGEPEPIEPAQGFLPGTQVGAYRLVRLLGSGGMGVVWLGERADGLYQRRVAIKLVRTVGPAEWVRRFRTEQRALAALDHPNIAKLLDAGTTDVGQPYFVMEYVEGTRIDHFGERSDLSTVDRLHLFRKVCDAVEYAHRNLVVHRDVKPSNILVDTHGKPTLLDFGIAKLLDEPGSLSSEGTRTLGRSYTPEYASPEQILGEPVTTATDVYSLGVVLYELLTGHRFRSGASDSVATLRYMAGQEPSRPSRTVQRSVAELRRKPRNSAAEPARRGGGPSDGESTDPDTVSALLKAERLQRALSGDLDMIVLKALRPEPELRYASVEQFSEDIRRHLGNLPIVARPDNWRYRARKFVRRNRTLAAALLVGALGLLATTIGTSVGLMQARRSHRDAEVQAEQYRREAQKARQVTSFLNKMITSTDPFTGNPGSATVRQMLDEAAAKIDAELGQYPEIESELRVTLGKTYQTLGLLDDAEWHLRRALELRRQVSGNDDLIVADILVLLATVRSKGNGSPPALALMREALDIRRGRLGDGHIDVAIAEADLAMASRTAGDLKVAEALYRHALPVLEEQLGPSHPKLATCLINLSGILSETGDYDSAVEFLRRATAVQERLADQEPTAAIDAFSHLSHLMHNQGDLAGAEGVGRQALDLARRLLGEQHPTVAALLRNMAYLRYEQGFIDEAIGLFRDSLSMLLTHYDDSSVAVADCVRGMGGMLWAKGDYAAAEESFHKYLAIEQNRSPMDEESPRIAVGYTSLGVVLRDAGRYQEAEPYLQRALEINLTLFGEGRRFVPYALINLARLNLLRGDYGVARDYCTRAIDLRSLQVAPEHHELAEGHLVLGMILTAQNDTTAAEPLLRDAMAKRMRVYGANHWLTAEANSALGECLMKAGRMVQAESLLSPSLETFDSTLETGHVLRRLTLRRLTELYERTNRFELAASHRELHLAAEKVAGVAGSAESLP